MDAPDAQGDGVWLDRCQPHMWLGRNGRLVVVDAPATYSDLFANRRCLGTSWRGRPWDSSPPIGEPAWQHNS